MNTNKIEKLIALKFPFRNKRKKTTTTTHEWISTGHFQDREHQ